MENIKFTIGSFQYAAAEFCFFYFTSLQTNHAVSASVIEFPFGV